MLTNLLLPTSSTKRSILERLNASLAQATAVRASVAFWTVPPNYLHPNFIRLMQGSESFCCVDVHWPTNFKVLALYHALGAHSFKVFCKELYQTGELQPRQSLLHAKLLVLDLPGDQAEVWVGSHNFTKNALGGTNWEASVVLSCAQSSDTFQEARAYVEAIRDTAGCLAFDPARVAEYEALQRGGYGTPGEGDLVNLLPLVGYDVLALRGKTLLLLGDDADGLVRFGRAEAQRAKLVVQAGDLGTRQNHLFEARIQSSGRIDELDETSYGIDFTPRPYALRRGQYIPYVAYRSQAFGGEQLREFTFWMNLTLGDIVSDKCQLSPVNDPALARWVVEPAETARVQATLERNRPPLRWVQPDLFTPKEDSQIWQALQEQHSREEYELGPPEVRVARFNKQSSVTTEPQVGYGSVEAAFEPNMLAAARPIYERQFQQRFFDQPDLILREPDVKPLLEGQLRALQQPQLLHRRRLHR